MSEILNLIKPGAQVILTFDNKAKGMVLQICIHRGNRIQYEVAWYDNGRRTTNWFEMEEIKLDDSGNTMSIGFNGGKI